MKQSMDDVMTDMAATEGQELGEAHDAETQSSSTGSRRPGRLRRTRSLRS